MRENSAICVAENTKRFAMSNSPMLELSSEYHLVVRFLERLPIGTRFPEVADRLAEVIKNLSVRAGSPKLYVDATGLGKPITDLVKSRVGVTVHAVYFNHGDRRVAEWGEVKLGKAYLVSRLQTLLQSGRLHLPKNEQSEILTAELLDYEIRVEEDANDRYGAFQVGTRDDLVTALGLAVQDDGAPTSSFMRGPGA
jgi:hypothetical protein